MGFSEPYITETRRKLNDEINGLNRKFDIGWPIGVLTITLMVVGHGALQRFNRGLPDASYLAEIVALGILGLFANVVVLQKRAGAWLGLLALYEDGDLRENYKFTKWEFWFPEQTLTKVMVPASGVLMAFPVFLVFWIFGFRPWFYLGVFWHILCSLLVLAGAAMVIDAPEQERQIIEAARKAAPDKAVPQA
jgi:hypothetical protein